RHDGEGEEAAHLVEAEVREQLRHDEDEHRRDGRDHHRLAQHRAAGQRSQGRARSGAACCGAHRPLLATIPEGRHWRKRMMMPKTITLAMEALVWYSMPAVKTPMPSAATTVPRIWPTPP